MESRKLVVILGWILIFGICSLFEKNFCFAEIPLRPTNVIAKSVPFRKIYLVWRNNVNTEVGYKIERRISDVETWSEIAQRPKDDTTYSDSDLKPATKYFYRVRAFNADGNSAYSDTAFATTWDINGDYAGTIILKKTTDFGVIRLNLAISHAAENVTGTINKNDLKTPFYPRDLNLSGKVIADTSFELQTSFQPPNANGRLTREISIDADTIRESGNILLGKYRETYTYFNLTKISAEGDFILNKTTNIVETPPLDLNGDGKIDENELLSRGADPRKIEPDALIQALDLFFANIKNKKSPISFGVMSKVVNSFLGK